MKLTDNIEKARRARLLAAWAVLAGLITSAIMTVGFHTHPAFCLGYVGGPFTVLMLTTARYNTLKGREEQLA